MFSVWAGYVIHFSSVLDHQSGPSRGGREWIRVFLSFGTHSPWSGDPLGDDNSSLNFHIHRRQEGEKTTWCVALWCQDSQRILVIRRESSSRSYIMCVTIQAYFHSGDWIFFTAVMSDLQPSPSGVLIMDSRSPTPSPEPVIISSFRAGLWGFIPRNHLNESWMSFWWSGQINDWWLFFEVQGPRRRTIITIERETMKPFLLSASHHLLSLSLSLSVSDQRLPKKRFGIRLTWKATLEDSWGGWRWWTRLDIQSEERTIFHSCMQIKAIVIRSGRDDNHKDCHVVLFLVPSWHSSLFSDSFFYYSWVNANEWGRGSEIKLDFKYQIIRRDCKQQADCHIFRAVPLLSFPSCSLGSLYISSGPPLLFLLGIVLSHVYSSCWFPADWC